MQAKKQAIEECLGSLNQALHEFSAGNRGLLFDSRDKLLDFTTLVADSPWNHVAPVCEIIQELLGHVLVYGKLGEEQTVRLATQLIGFVSASLHQPAAIPEAQAPHSLVAAGGEPGYDEQYDDEEYESDQYAAPSAGSLDNLINESRLGNILMSLGKVSPDQVQQALEIQRESEERIGSILVAMGAIDEATLQHALTEQRQATLRLTGGGHQVRHDPEFDEKQQAHVPAEPLTLRLGDDAPQVGPSTQREGW